MKYDNQMFLGVEDKTVVLKKCGPSNGYDTGTRDAVLSGLAGSGGYFRIGGSGELKGMAQCVGDLSFGECQDCVNEAIKRLRNDCPAADYGDMFLEKCYARYSTGGRGGAHSYSNKPHGKAQNFSTCIHQKPKRIFCGDYIDLLRNIVSIFFFDKNVIVSMLILGKFC